MDVDVWMHNQLKTYRRSTHDTCVGAHLFFDHEPDWSIMPLLFLPLPGHHPPLGNLIARSFSAAWPFKPYVNSRNMSSMLRTELEGPPRSRNLKPPWCIACKMVSAVSVGLFPRRPVLLVSAELNSMAPSLGTVVWAGGMFTLSAISWK